MKYQNLAKDPWTQNLALGPNYLMCDFWYPGIFTRTHILGLREKILNFLINLILSLRPLGPDIWQKGPNYLKHWLLGSRWVHRHPYCGVLWENCKFFDLVPKGWWTKNLVPGSKLPQIWMLGSRWVHSLPYCGVLWENEKFWIWGQRALGPKIWSTGLNHF